MIVYFSGTGNSRYCARLLADSLDDECVDAFRFIRDGIAADLVSGRPWVFVSPTYGWQLPRVFADLIRGGRFAGSRDAYFVMTCGADIGNSSLKNQALCAEVGLRCCGTLEVVMPENYIALFNAPEDSEAREIIAAARPVLEHGIACIREGRPIPPRKPGIADALKSGIVNTVFYRFIIKAKPFTVSDACAGCGKCERACPLGNIRLEGGKPVWGGRCTHCMACICGCPAGAIEYGRASRGKPRYQCPPYERLRETMIRPFEAGDTEQVMRLWLEGNLDAHAFIPGDYWLSNAPAVREQLLQAELHVFERNGQILGFAGMQGDYLAGIFVDRAHRSAGIGRQLLDHIKARHPAFTLNVYRRNRQAVDFYLREGLLLTEEALDEDTGETDCTMRWDPRETPSAGPAAREET